MFKLKWWTKYRGDDKVDLHFTQTALDRIWDPSHDYYRITFWCPISSRNILIGIEYV